MKIVQLTPGTGDAFYCENCLRDRETVRAWRAMGHDCLMVPLYLPLSMEADAGGTGPIFFGGVNVYLQQHLALFRHTPRWLDRLFDARGLLRRVGKLAGMTSASDLGRTTLSMLDGQNGRQRKELKRLVEWLAGRERPDVVVLSNALLLGMVRRLKEALGGVKVACLLQDEDEFVDALGDEDRARVWARMAQRAADVDVFVATSRHFAELMRERLNLPAGRLHVVHVALPVEEYEPAASSPDPPVVGFLSRMCRPKGLDLLAEAFIRLKATPELRNLKLRAAGGKTAADDEYVGSIHKRLGAAGMADDAELLPNLPGEQRKEFLRSLSVLSVPDRRGEAAGMFILESLACGVPVVLPRTGAAPELVDATGGGVLYEPNDADSLAAALKELLLDPARMGELGRRGRQAVIENFRASRAAAALLEIFERAAQ